MLERQQILDVEACTTAAIHLVIPRSRIQEVMGPALAELSAALRAQGIAPAGPWLTHHLRMSPDAFDFEVAMPVAQAVKPVGRVHPSGLPGATVARALYRGDYAGLFQAWAEFERWIDAQGRTRGETLWETYLTDPHASPDPSTWVTELTRPLR